MSKKKQRPLFHGRALRWTLVIPREKKNITSIHGIYFSLKCFGYFGL
jgi:hypothetical protein